MPSTARGAFTTELGRSGQDGLEEISSTNGPSTEFTASGPFSTRAGMCICELIKIDLCFRYFFILIESINLNSFK